MSTFINDSFEIKPNPNIEPSFTEPTSALLKKNYINFDPDPEFCEYLKGTFCSKIKCGLSKYPVNETTGEVINQTDGEEWCFVYAEAPVPDPQFNECYIKAADLEPILEDLELEDDDFPCPTPTPLPPLTSL